LQLTFASHWIKGSTTKHGTNVSEYFVTRPQQPDKASRLLVLLTRSSLQAELQQPVSRHHAPSTYFKIDI